jgi:hypothetical protein
VLYACAGAEALNLTHGLGQLRRLLGRHPPVQASEPAFQSAATVVECAGTLATMEELATIAAARAALSSDTWVSSAPIPKSSAL